MTDTINNENMNPDEPVIPPEVTEPPIDPQEPPQEPQEPTEPECECTCPPTCPVCYPENVTPPSETTPPPSNGTDIIGGEVDEDGDVTITPLPENPLGLTPEEIEKVWQVRLMIADSPGSPFYPLFTDDEIVQFLKMSKWVVSSAVRSAAIAASMNFSQMAYRERTGDIEVWNNVSLQYLKSLEPLINGGSSSTMDNRTLRPFFGGIDRCDVESKKNNPNNVRSPLAMMGERSKCNGYGHNVVLVIQESKNNEQTPEEPTEPPVPEAPICTCVCCNKPSVPTDPEDNDSGAEEDTGTMG